MLAALCVSALLAIKVHSRGQPASIVPCASKREMAVYKGLKRREAHQP